tara:strand:+ start:3069 stop:3896 length:828 start_codon:yes stop_codon:yes gene_type:complete
MFNGILSHESYVLLDGYHLTGVNSVSVSSKNSSSVISPIGTEMGLTIPSGPTQQSMSLSRHLIYQDPFFDYVGKDRPVKGEIHDLQNESFYGFESGYIKNYSVNCAVGSIPKVNTSFTILDEIKSGKVPEVGVSKKTHNTIESSSQGSISIESEDFQNNRVVGFDYSISVDQDVSYAIGSTLPFYIKEKRPIKYTASVQLELDKTYNSQSFDFLNSRQDRTISMDVKGRRGASLQYIEIPNASLVSRNLSQTAKGLMIMNLSYVGHLGADRDFLP